MSKLIDFINKVLYGSSASVVVKPIDTKIKVFLDSRSDAELAKLVDELFWEGPQRNGGIFDEVSKDERVRKCIAERASRYGDRSKAEADVFGSPNCDFDSKVEQVKSSAANYETELWNFDEWGKWGDEGDSFPEPNDVDDPKIEDPSLPKESQFSILSKLKAVIYPAEPTQADGDLISEEVEAVEQENDKASFATYDAAAIRDFMSKNSFDDFRNDWSAKFVDENLEALHGQAPTVSELLNPLFENGVDPAIQKPEKIGVDPQRDFDDFNFEDVQWDVSDIVDPESLNRDRVKRTVDSGPKVETFPDPNNPTGRLVDPSDDVSGDQFDFEESSDGDLSMFHDTNLATLDSPHKDLFWTMASEKPFLWKPENDLGPKETQAIRLFLFRLAKCVEHRGLLLNADSFQRMAEHLKPGRVSAMLSEPWLSYRKLNTYEAIQLALATTDAMLEILSFDDIRLQDGFANTKEHLKLKLSSGRVEDLVIFSNSLRGFHGLMGDTFATTYDYIAACLGDRDSMAKVAVHIEDYLKSPASKWLLGYLVHDLTIQADNWWRLHTAGMRNDEENDIFFTTVYSAASFDLRDIASENKSVLDDALILPLPSDAAKAAMEALSKMRSRGVPADWDNDFIKGDDKREPLGRNAGSRISMQDVERVSKSRTVTVLDRITASDSDIEKSYGNLRNKFPIIDVLDADHIFLELNREFPWMEELNEYVARSVAMAARKDGGFVFKPVLLCGPSGVGKSRWARKVSEVTTVPMHRANLSGLSTSKSIVGSERGWSSARPSLPALAFSKLEVANPIIFVDEVDKSGVGSNGDAIAGLLPMLEMETAAKYPDPFLLGDMDLTRVSWVFTANSIGGLHQEFLDRVKVFNVSKPSNKDHRLIVDGLVKAHTADFDFMDEGFWEGIEALRTEALTAMGSGRSIRAVKELIEDGVAKLVWKKPSHLRIVK